MSARDTRSLAELEAALADLQAQDRQMSALRQELYRQECRAQYAHDRIKQQLRSIQGKRERRIRKQAS